MQPQHECSVNAAVTVDYHIEARRLLKGTSFIFPFNVCSVLKRGSPQTLSSILSGEGLYEGGTRGIAPGTTRVNCREPGFCCDTLVHFCIDLNSIPRLHLN